MATYERRIVIPETAPDLKVREDRRDEELRIASFAYSRTVVAGSRPSFRYDLKPQQEQ